MKLKEEIEKHLERRHPECFYKPTTFRVDKEVMIAELIALFAKFGKEIIGSRKCDCYWEQGNDCQCRLEQRKRLKEMIER